MLYPTRMDFLALYQRGAGGEAVYEIFGCVENHEGD